jgi:hypothetical protein
MHYGHRLGGPDAGLHADLRRPPGECNDCHDFPDGSETNG